MAEHNRIMRETLCVEFLFLLMIYSSLLMLAHISFMMMTPLLTPLNLSILAIIVTVVYLRLRPSSTPTLPQGPQPIVFRTFTPRTLLINNGKGTAPVYLAVKGKVYDVTSGRNFYGPGGPYENFAGRDATRGLACQSFDEEMLTKNLDGPLDECKDLTAEQLDNLNGWVERFEEKVSLFPRTVRLICLLGM